MRSMGLGAEQVPPQAGRLAVVTGATGGIGYEIALALAQGCADVIVAGRNEARGRGVAGKIRSLAPRSLVRFEKLDLSELASVKAFANRLAAQGRPVDLLLNNAGVMALPSRQVTSDGFEMQFATNYLGHFALTALLLPLLRLNRGSRVVTVSSVVHRLGKICFEDLQGKHRYRPWTAYFQSKLAALLFARELQDQSDTHGWGLLSCAVHPGYAQTGLIANGTGRASLLSLLSRSFGRILSQSAAEGAWSALFAAVSEEAEPGGFYGPGGLFEFAGPPASAYVSMRARDHAVARELWRISSQLAGVSWPADLTREWSPPAEPVRLQAQSSS